MTEPVTMPLWRCDFCGGPAWWTIHLGEAIYYCKEQCDGFTQLNLFEAHDQYDSSRAESLSQDSLDSPLPSADLETPLPFPRLPSSRLKSQSPGQYLYLWPNKSDGWRVRLGLWVARTWRDVAALLRSGIRR